MAECPDSPVAVPAGRRVATRIAAEEAGNRLDAWLAGRFTYHTRSRWQQVIGAGRITVNGAPARPACRLRAGDEIRFAVDDLAEPPVDDRVAVLREDSWFLAVDKPAPLPCHPAGPFFRHTLWHLLRERFGEVHLVNRLDRETSGIVLVARSPEAAAALAASGLRKRYLAIVEGRFPEACAAVGHLVADGGCEVRKRRRFLPAGTVAPDPLPADAETSRTRFRRLGTDGTLSLVEAELETGRTHQIRATLLALGHPLVGDKLYGPDPGIFLRFAQDRLTPDDQVRLRLPRQALHAHRLDFAHPGDGSRVSIVAPLPAILRQLCAASWRDD